MIREIDGAANEELVRFLADLFDRPESTVALVRGEGSRAREMVVWKPAVSS